ncbi:MAG: hypothetical protein M3417_11575, partial [Actinomycetota bacterium]|nr:hypothetical protein [Actinomycetota bacterium]
MRQIAVLLALVTTLPACSRGADAARPRAPQPEAAGSDVAASRVSWRSTQRLSVGPSVDGSTVAPFPAPPRVGIDDRGGAAVVWASQRARGRGRLRVL